MDLSQEYLSDRFAGCLLGGAIGDALGFTAENLSRKRIQEKFGRLRDYHVKPHSAYFTDDTQLTIALAESLLTKGGFDLDHFRRKLARWYLVVPRISGRSTKNAALKCLFNLRETGYDVPGSSGAMRASPLALFYCEDEQTLIDKTVECCRVTHINRSAIAGALVVTGSVYYALHNSGAQLDVSAYLAKISSLIRDYDDELSQRITKLETMLDTSEDNAVEELLRNSKITGAPIGDIIACAIYAFIKFPNDFESSVQFCANAGWDTDTMAAINGNICGTWNGLSKLPDRLIQGLENGYKGRDYIALLAKLMVSQSKPPPLNPLTDYVEDCVHNLCYLVDTFRLKPMY